MFGSEILDVAIGVIFVFLLVSLIASAIREGLEGWLKTRATHLEAGIRELLHDPKGTGLTKPPVSRAIDCMVERGILVETTGRQRDRIFAYRRYLDLLAEGTEPLARS